eukprot:TRINITY_DN1552_c0_g1_i1.p1 TRINITY_DN1552_c0_g1~~TRINITY_DN1552_c0_g1_i1.p1  ORF type:complete len:236 (-),score=69.49 TRINITY_DN1552_c0_g1_i1:55-663(-)
MTTEEESLNLNAEMEETNKEETVTDSSSVGATDADAEIEEMRRRVREMEEEAKKLTELQNEVEKDSPATSAANREEIDGRSVYVGNVDYGATPEELQAHFQSCGTINRITILCDKFTGHPKGFAYVEFLEKDALVNALVLNESLFRGRQIKVTSKRTNQPSFVLRGRGAAGVFRGRPRFNTFAAAAPRGRFRARRAHYHPYA